MPPLDNKIAGKIKEAVISFDPEAEVYIYGSRARGDASPESDWDVMVITPHTVTPQLKRSIRHALYEIEWEHGCVISSIIRSRGEWNTTRMRMTPFYRNVTRNAVRI
jgi:predicted nucleotidyltransferase